MIDALDETLRQLLQKELPVRNNEIEISFDQPKREWSARLSRPTLNLFLYDLRENMRLRNPSPGWAVTRDGNGRASQRPPAHRVDLHYMVTAWANDPGDEHRLLTGALMALFRSPEIPMALLPESLQDQPAPITIQTAQADSMTKPTDLWGVLDNEMRPALSCVVTLALNPFEALQTPLVRTRELRLGPSERPPTRTLDEVQHRWAVGGRIRSPEPLVSPRLRLIEMGRTIEVGEDGTWKIDKLQAGEYTLELSMEGHPPRQHRIQVPSSEYDLDW